MLRGRICEPCACFEGRTCRSRPFVVFVIVARSRDLVQNAHQVGVQFGLDVVDGLPSLLPGFRFV